MSADSQSNVFCRVKFQQTLSQTYLVAFNFSTSSIERVLSCLMLAHSQSNVFCRTRIVVFNVSILSIERVLSRLMSASIIGLTTGSNHSLIKRNLGYFAYSSHQKINLFHSNYILHLQNIICIIIKIKYKMWVFSQKNNNKKHKLFLLMK